ncbi:hypothetical protein EG68_01713 [Paragonimus skrjabini miyazakii]|uniref:Uncharacterized protein n=1 Tax=Paragonimus skrjabini miyazakii TaxID=59628 RepID=A0A8S9Z6Y1_9TREM|nr:hypothetical protein EG68_01713 [Paragonimus skrjabini miyazakii]
MTLMRLTLMLLHIPWLAATQCELVSSDLDDCAHQLGMTKLPNNSEGFGFGFGSVRDVELMCRTKWHLKVYICAHQTIISRCTGGSDSQFRTAMWEFIFDTTRYARAATYLCRAHNLRIFRFHRDICLIPHESRVQNCSEAYMAFVFAATKQLAAHNPSHLTDETAYADYMKGELTKMYCLAITDKLKCVASQMKPPCTADVVALVRNYYRETLPDQCSQYIPGLESSVETKSSQSKRTVNETNSVRNAKSQKATLKVELIQKSQRNGTSRKSRIFLPLAETLLGWIDDSSLLSLRIMYICFYAFLWNLCIYLTL